MYKKEDFNTTIDWVTYKVTGKVKGLKKKETPTMEYNLKFYPNNRDKNGRGYVQFSTKGESRGLCSCEELQFKKIQDEFNEQYNGENLEDLIPVFRDKYNQRIRGKRKQSFKVKRGRKKNTSLKNATLKSNKRGKRMEMRTRLNGETHHICMCYPYQVDECVKEFNRMKKKENYDIPMIRNALSEKYNVKGKTKTPNILIDKNGLIYKDGKFIKENKGLYNLVYSMIGD